ncbi:MAG: long-chain fatty acid--CoA ligase [Chitinophagaceae bacterium]|nr:long-chain fatty acid--CoA ligase [Chitinophagaceae bacterium]
MKGLMMHFPLTVPSILEYGNRVFPSKQVVTLLPNGSLHRYAFADLYRRSRRLSEVLRLRWNIAPGDRIATFAWNQYQHLELYYAIPGAGAVCHPLNIRLSVSQIAWIINDAQDKVIFIDASLVPVFEKVIPMLDHVPDFVIINADKDFKAGFRFMHYEDLELDTPATQDWVAADEDDACGMCYTTGTTGEPKGVLYSHRSTYLHAMSIMSPNAFNISMHDTALLIVPQFHVMAWGFPYVCILAGANMIMPSSHLQSQAIVQLIQQEKVTIANGVPAIWLQVLDYLKKNPPAEKLTLREFFVGGSAVPESLLQGFDELFGIRGVHAWGMTETSPLGTISRLQPHHERLSPDAQRKIRSKQGIEMPAVELRLIKEDGTIAARDGETTGEFEIRGAWVAGRYYNSEAHSDQAFVDGWFKTGDVGTIDPDGYMLITDRKKDLIKSGGEWISSIALETALVAHPSIKEACVIAVPDAKWAERPLACIVIEDGTTVSPDDLKTFLKGSFASFQVPDQYVVMQEIPKTSVGKLNKKALRKLYQEGELKPVK